MISRCYLEITNVCNLNCLFCPKTTRAKRWLTDEEFDQLTDKLRDRIKFLYFHLMGEPFLHPSLPKFIRTAREKGFVPVITTNGTLLRESDAILEAMPHKIQISIHSQEGNRRDNYEDYMRRIMLFAQQAAAKGIIIVLRLWNQGGYDSRNQLLLDLAAQYVPRPWTERYDGWKLTTHIYIEFDKMFEWPDVGHEEYAESEVFCYALRNQIGVLVDGTVVPCCLDHDGTIALGNLFHHSLEEILASPRARGILDGFTRHTASEELCRKCGYAAVTKRFRK